MSEHSQIFVIAEIGDRYRCLCAVDHSNLWNGFGPVKRCLCLLKIFEDPENRLPIEQELISARKYEEEFWDQIVSESKRFIAFPFIAICLTIGASFDATDGYYFRVKIEPWDMQFDGGSNDEGIMILDITKPNHVRYCFVKHQRSRTQVEMPLMTPLSADSYLDVNHPYPSAEYQQVFERLLRDFEGRDLVDVDALCDTWPRGEWEDSNDNDESSSGRSNFSEPEENKPDSVPSLEALALEKLVSILINEPSSGEPSVLAEARLVASFLPRLRAVMYERASSLTSSPMVARHLLEVLEGEKILDLVPFAHLGATFLAGVFTELQGPLPTTTINLSNSDINEEELTDILSACPNLETLYLLETPNLSIGPVLATIKKLQLRIRDLYHTDILYKSLETRWSVIRRNPVVGPDFFQPVVELVWVSISCKQERPIDWSKLVPKKVKPFDWRYFRDHDMTYLSIPLGNAPLSLAKLLTGIINAFTYALSGATQTAELPWILARCFATGGSSVASSSEYRIGPPSMPLLLKKSRASPNGTRGTLADNEFAIIAIDDCYDWWAEDELKRESVYWDYSEPLPGSLTKGVRYALVRPKADDEDDFDILDMAQFLEVASQLNSNAFADSDTAAEMNAYWTQKTGDVGAISLCTSEEALAIARNAFGENQVTSTSRLDNEYESNTCFESEIARPWS